MTSTTILIAEDHALLADALQLLLGAQPDMVCVGLAKDGEQAMALATTLRPDVLLLDLGLPRLDGLGVLEALSRAQLPTRVLVVTARLDEERPEGVENEAGAWQTLP
jgi:DNA-binding NarL/FixJ family response regulator